jgi:hypothetical protein
MEPEQQHPRPFLFTLRLWQEPLGQDEFEWRGRVQSVVGGDTLFFRDWSGLVATLQRLVATAATLCEDGPEETLPDVAEYGTMAFRARRQSDNTHCQW